MQPCAFSETVNHLSAAPAIFLDTTYFATTRCEQDRISISWRTDAGKPEKRTFHSQNTVCFRSGEVFIIRDEEATAKIHLMQFDMAA